MISAVKANFHYCYYCSIYVVCFAIDIKEIFHFIEGFLFWNGIELRTFLIKADL